MNEEWLYILNYCNGKLYEIKLTPEEQEEELDMEIFFKEYGLNVDECSWMFSSERLNLETIDRI